MYKRERGAEEQEVERRGGGKREIKMCIRFMFNLYESGTKSAAHKKSKREMVEGFYIRGGWQGCEECGEAARGRGRGKDRARGLPFWQQKLLLLPACRHVVTLPASGAFVNTPSWMSPVFLTPPVVPISWVESTPCLACCLFSPLPACTTAASCRFSLCAFLRFFFLS